MVGELAQLFKSYRISSICGDRYGGEWPREQFSKFGISYEPAPKPKSSLYIDLLPLINSARIELLDHPRLISQLCALERRTARGGRDTIDHAAGRHDDVRQRRRRPRRHQQPIPRLRSQLSGLD